MGGYGGMEAGAGGGFFSLLVPALRRNRRENKTFIDINNSTSTHHPQPSTSLGHS
jgi:hypothetical protein